MLRMAGPGIAPEKGDSDQRMVLRQAGGIPWTRNQASTSIRTGAGPAKFHRGKVELPRGRKSAAPWAILLRQGLHACRRHVLPGLGRSFTNRREPAPHDVRGSGMASRAPGPPPLCAESSWSGLRHFSRERMAGRRRPEAFRDSSRSGRDFQRAIAWSQVRGRVPVQPVDSTESQSINARSPGEAGLPGFLRFWKEPRAPSPPSPRNPPPRGRRVPLPAVREPVRFVAGLSWRRCYSCSPLCPTLSTARKAS